MTLPPLALASACLAAALLAGCASGMKTYPDSDQKNTVVHVKSDRGSFFTRTRPDIHLYSVSSACRAEYLGTVKLDEPSIHIGLPIGQTVLLAFEFSSSSLGGNQASSIIEMMTTPRKGIRYEFEVAYQKKSYSATGVEFHQGQSQGREMEHRRLRDCVENKKKAGL
jgi:hypothetical protein